MARSPIKQGKVGSIFIDDKGGYVKFRGVEVIKDKSGNVQYDEFGQARKRAVFERREHADYRSVKVRTFYREITNQTQDSDPFYTFGKGMGGFTRMKTYTSNLESKVNKGFQSWVNNLRIDGLSKSKAYELESKWNMLTNDQKGKVWNLYNKSSTVTTYGSDSIDYSAGMNLDVNSYVDVFEQAIDEVIEQD